MLLKVRTIQQLLALLISLSLILPSATVNQVFAQSSDNLSDAQPPVIEHESTGQGRAGDTQVISAKINDDQSLLAAVLFYRFSGDEQFNSVDMQLVDGESVFSASIVTSASDVRDIEYFIQAEDTAGNRAIKGFTFDPLVFKIYPARTTTDSADAVNSSATPTEEIATESRDQTVQTPASSGSVESNSRGRIMWGLVGLLAVVGIAVLLNQDDDDDSPSPLELADHNGRLLAIEW